LALVASPHHIRPRHESRQENGIMLVAGLQRPFATLSANNRTAGQLGVRAEWGRVQM
jgi:hypothetical protein